MRIAPDIMRRVELVAEKERSNARIVIEQCLDAYLPVLEKMSDRRKNLPSFNALRASDAEHISLAN